MKHWRKISAWMLFLSLKHLNSKLFGHFINDSIRRKVKHNFLLVSIEKGKIQLEGKKVIFPSFMSNADIFSMQKILKKISNGINYALRYREKCWTKFHNILPNIYTQIVKKISLKHFDIETLVHQLTFEKNNFVLNIDEIGERIDF